MTEAAVALLREAKKDPAYAAIVRQMYGSLGPENILGESRELSALHVYAEQIVRRSAMRQQLAAGPEEVGVTRR